VFIENIMRKREKGSDAFNSVPSLVRAGVILVHIFFQKNWTWLKNSTFGFDKTQKRSHFTLFAAKKIGFKFRGFLVLLSASCSFTLHVWLTTYFSQLYCIFMAYVLMYFEVPCFFVVRKNNNVSLVNIPKKQKNA